MQIVIAIAILGGLGLVFGLVHSTELAKSLTAL